MKNIYFLTLFIFCYHIASSQTTFETLIGGELAEYGYSVEQTSDGGYITAGKTSDFDTGISDIYLVKIDHIGDTIWTKTIDIENIVVATKIIQTNDGGYVIAGLSGINASNRSGFLIKMNQIGDTIWCKDYEYLDWNKVDVVQPNDSIYVIMGSTNSIGAGWSDILFIKVDQYGNEILSKTYGSYEDD